MPRIARVRPVLLSAPYASPDNLEVQIYLKNGLKTCSLVEITLDDGTTGLGEGYLGVFAPQVFAEIVKLVAPYLVGREAFDTRALYTELCNITGYWSFQGAARHVVSACEIALIDAKAKILGVPAYQLLGGATDQTFNSTAAAATSTYRPGCCGRWKPSPAWALTSLIRARNFEVAKPSGY